MSKRKEDAMDEAKQKRQEVAAAKVRGKNSIIFRRVKAESLTPAMEVFVPICTENEGIRTEKDARDFITEKDLLG